MYSSKFGVYHIQSITSVWKTLFHECPSIRPRIRNLPHNQQASAHIRSWRNTWEGCSRLSVECTPPNMVCTTSSSLLMSAKLCSMIVHRSVHYLEIYRIISSPGSISYTRGIIGSAVVGCPSNPHLQVWCLTAPLNHLCLLNIVPCVCIDPLKI